MTEPTKPTGGPAFPQPSRIAPYEQYFDICCTGGMTLRQWYAGMALQSIVAWPDGPSREKDAQGMAVETYEDACARVSFAYADAMIKQGNK